VIIIGYILTALFQVAGNFFQSVSQSVS